MRGLVKVDAAEWAGCRLLQFHVIPDEELTQAEGGQDRSGIGSGSQHDALADHFARSVIPLPLLRRAAEAVDAAKDVGFLVVVECGPLGFVCEFVLGASVAEDAEVIAHADPLLAAEVHEEYVVGAQLHLEAFADHYHRGGFTAERREAVEIPFGLQWRRGALLERQEDVAALYVVAGVFYLRDSGVRLRDNHAHAAFVFPPGTQLADDRELPLGPLDF